MNIIKLLFLTPFLILISCDTINADKALKIHVNKSKKYEVHWDDEFTLIEKDKLIRWVDTTFAAASQTYGDIPLKIDVYFERATNCKEPVPFAKASRRNNEQALYFYVCPQYKLQEFMSDWTAQHEISHLTSCFIGKEYRWFSEGYATYLSRQIMIRQGYITNEGFDSLYYNKGLEALELFSSQKQTFTEVADSLMKNHVYGPIYWAGSTFFYMADQYLIDNYYGKRFVDLLRDYQTFCRLKDHSIDAVIKSYDELTNSTFFSNLFDLYNNQPAYKVKDYFANHSYLL